MPIPVHLRFRGEADKTDMRDMQDVEDLFTVFNDEKTAESTMTKFSVWIFMGILFLLLLALFPHIVVEDSLVSNV